MPTFPQSVEMSCSLGMLAGSGLLFRRFLYLCRGPRAGEEGSFDGGVPIDCCEPARGGRKEWQGHFDDDGRGRRLEGGDVHEPAVGEA